MDTTTPTSGRVESQLTERLNPDLVRLLSTLGLIGLMVVIFVLIVAFRDSRIGLFALGGIGGVGLAILIFFRPEFGAYALAFTVFTNLSSIFTTAGLPSINRPLVALVFVSLVANYLMNRDRKPLRFSAVEGVLFTFLGVLMVTSLFAVNRGASFSGIIDIGKDVIIILCIVQALRDPVHWKTTVWIMIGSAAFLTSLSAYQVLTGNYGQTFFGLATVDFQGLVEGFNELPRTSGPIAAPNFWAQSITALMPLVIYRILDEKNVIVKGGAAVAALLILFGIMNTYSRGAFITLVFIVGLILIERKASINLLLAAGLLVVMSLPFLPEGYVERILTLQMFTSAEDDILDEVSFRGRSNQIRVGVMMFAENPLFGVGYQNYYHEYQDYAALLGTEFRTSGRDAHSLPIQLMAETGVIGTLTWAALLLAIGSRLWATRQKFVELKADSWVMWTSAIGLALVSYMISSIILHMHFLRYWWLLLALALSLTYVAEDTLIPRIKARQQQAAPAVATTTTD